MPRAPAPTKTKAQKAAAASSSGKGKKKKWSKGKVKDKAQNLIVLDKPTYDRLVHSLGCTNEELTRV